MSHSSSPAHRVLLIREWDQQTTGSGCCGRLEGGDSELAGAADFTATRVQMERMGAVYRALVAELSRAEVDVQIVDPRNLVFLVPTLIRDARRHGRSWRDVLHQLRTGVAQGTIVVDGRVVASGEIPPPDQATGLVLRALQPARP
ncbi:MAG: hypothetical protein ACOC9I_00505 [Actinomycetota bacterium]